MKQKYIIFPLAAFVVAAAPLAASAIVSDSPDTAPTVTAAIGEVITVTASNPPSISLTPSTTGPVTTSVTHNVSVTSNVGAGYNLTLQDVDATTALTGSGTAAGQTIAASANTTAAPAALANNTWGFAIAGGVFDASYSAQNNVVNATTKWAGVPANGSPYNIRSTTAVASGETTAVWYAAEVDYTKPNGSYTNTVLYTGTTK